MNWSQWITDNYDFLKLWSKRWAGQHWGELLSCFTTYLEKNWQRKYLKMNDDERIRFTQTWMKNMSKWSNSEFNRDISVNNFSEEWSIEDTYESLNEIRAEVTNDIAEWLIDLHQNFAEDDVIKIVKIRSIYLQLETHEKVLYDLYFNNMHSLREIGKKLNLPHSAIFQMVNALKQKIIDML